MVAGGAKLRSSQRKHGASADCNVISSDSDDNASPNNNSTKSTTTNSTNHSTNHNNHQIEQASPDKKKAKNSSQTQSKPAAHTKATRSNTPKNPPPITTIDSDESSDSEPDQNNTASSATTTKPQKCSLGARCHDAYCAQHFRIPSAAQTHRKALTQSRVDLSLEKSLASPPAASLVPFCGLRNLGATCYLNSLIQFLFMTTQFRDAVLEWNDTGAPNDNIVRKLRLLFAKMGIWPLAWLDPSDFVHALKVPTGVQQDVEEFRKLFFNHLEQGNRLERVIKNMFGGDMRHVITCSHCNNESEGSKRVVTFYELDLVPHDGRGIEDSLGALFAEELLDGDNKYSCDHCKSKQNARKSIVVDKFPPVLFLSFRRYSFDIDTQSRQKTASRVSFPYVLDLDSLFVTRPTKSKSRDAKQSQNSNKKNYKLVGVFSHAGSSAVKGHYTVDLLDHKHESWWRFNDEEVTQLEAPAKPHPTEHDRLQSADAYLLVYSSIPPVASNDCALAESIEEAVHEAKQANADFLDAKEQLDAIEAKLNKHREDASAVLQILLNASKPTKAQLGDWCWVSSAGLKDFFSDPDLTRIEQKELTCEHGALLHPACAGKAKHIPLTAWSILAARGIEVDVEIQRKCEDCEEEITKQKHKDSTRQEQAVGLAKKLGDEIERPRPPAGAVLIEKALVQMLIPRRKGNIQLPPLTRRLNQELLCEHHRLKPGAEAYKISRQLFVELSVLFIDFEEISAKVPPCSDCLTQNEILRQQQEDRKDEKQVLRKELAVLLELARHPDQTMPLGDNGTTIWYAVDREWVSDLHAFLYARGNKTLPNLTNERICCEHNKPFVELVGNDHECAFAFAQLYCVVPEAVWSVLWTRFPNARVARFELGKDSGSAKGCCNALYVQAQTELQNRLQDWENRIVKVRLVGAEEEPPASEAPVPQRKGLRSRSKTKTTVELKVSAHTTVSALKLAYSQANQCFPSQVTIFIPGPNGDQPLDGDAQLKDCGILPGSTVLAVVDRTVPDPTMEESVAFEGTALLDS